MAILEAIDRDLNEPGRANLVGLTEHSEATLGWSAVVVEPGRPGSWSRRAAITLRVWNRRQQTLPRTQFETLLVPPPVGEAAEEYEADQRDNQAPPKGSRR
jgi:hypothetical protein